MATMSNAAFTGVTLETSFAVLKTWMAKFNVERSPSRAFDCWDLSVMVKMRGSHEKVVRVGAEEEPGLLSRWALTHYRASCKWSTVELIT